MLFIWFLLTKWLHVSDSEVKLEFNVDPFVLRACFTLINFLTNFSSLFSKRKPTYDGLIFLFGVDRHFYVTQGAISFESAQCKSSGFHIFGNRGITISSRNLHFALRIQPVKGIKGTSMWNGTKQSDHRHNWYNIALETDKIDLNYLVDWILCFSTLNNDNKYYREHYKKQESRMYESAH